MKKIVLLSTLSIIASFTNLFANKIDPTPASYDFNVQNWSQDTLVRLEINALNPNWIASALYSEERHYETNEIIDLNPGEEYIKRDLELINPSFDILTQSEDSPWKSIISGSFIKGNKNSWQSAAQNSKNGQTTKYDISFDSSQNKGSLTFKLSHENSDL